SFFSAPQLKRDSLGSLVSVHMILDIALGAALGTVLVLLARWVVPRSENAVLAVGLLITAVLYVAFAILGRAGVQWFALEIIGVLIFGALAWLGMTRSLIWLAVGWGTHVGWDVGWHLGAEAPKFVPSFFPTFC